MLGGWKVYLALGTDDMNVQISRERPVERCIECGSVYRMEYVGPPHDAHAHDDHGHGHDHHSYEEPKTFADYVRPEYRYRG